MTAPRLKRAGAAYVEALASSLSNRDRAIIDTVHRLRLVTGKQLERLHFHPLPYRSRSVMRWRVLKRLVDTRILVPVPRHGVLSRRSAELCYALDTAGQRLVQLHANLRGERPVRRFAVPGDRFIAHTLAVAEVYSSLAERAEMTAKFVVTRFEIEAAWPDGRGGMLRPDAFLVLQAGRVQDFWWIEADLATESLPTIAAKLRAYLDFVQRGQRGPEDVLPRVLFTVPTEARRDAICAVVGALPDPAGHMFAVVTAPDAADFLRSELFIS